jgi:hypothetical protein
MTTLPCSAAADCEDSSSRVPARTLADGKAQLVCPSSRGRCTAGGHGLQVGSRAVRQEAWAGVAGGAEQQERAGRGGGGGGGGGGGAGGGGAGQRHDMCNM